MGSSSLSFRQILDCQRYLSFVHDGYYRTSVPFSELKVRVKHSEYDQNVSGALLRARFNCLVELISLLPASYNELVAALIFVPSVTSSYNVFILS